MSETTFDDLKFGDVFIALKGARGRVDGAIDGLCVGKMFMRLPQWESPFGAGNAIEMDIDMGNGAPGISNLEAARNYMCSDGLYDVKMTKYWCFTEGCEYPVLHLGNALLSTNKCDAQDE